MKTSCTLAGSSCERSTAPASTVHAGLYISFTVTSCITSTCIFHLGRLTSDGMAAQLRGGQGCKGALQAAERCARCSYNDWTAVIICTCVSFAAVLRSVPRGKGDGSSCGSTSFTASQDRVPLVAITGLSHMAWCGNGVCIARDLKVHNGSSPWIVPIDGDVENVAPGDPRPS